MRRQRLPAWIFGFGIALFFCGCGSHQKYQWTRVDLRSQGPQLDVPHPVLRKFDQVVRKDDDKDKVRLLSLQILLTERTPGVLDHRSFDIDLGEGGGAIDLTDYVDPSLPGDYTFKVKTTDKNLGQFYVLFVPGRQPQKLGGDVYGLPCQDFVNVSSFFHSTLMGNGLRLTNRRHLDSSTITGTFLIGAKGENGWRVAAIGVKDSSTTQMACPKLAPATAGL